MLMAEKSPVVQQIVVQNVQQIKRTKHRRQRENASLTGSQTLVFGARKPDDLPYFGPLQKVPETFMRKIFAFSRLPDRPKQHVQDQLRANKEEIARILQDPKSYSYVCGLKAMEGGVDDALAELARDAGLDWASLRDALRESGRYHVETY